MSSELDAVIARCLSLQRETRELVLARQAISAEFKQVCKTANAGRLLVRMAEGLIDAHKAAKIDDNGLTIDLIEDAMRHVGERLARENGIENNFSQKRLSPYR